MQELVFPQVPVKCWVLHTYIHSFLDGPGMIVYFLVEYAELFCTHGMSSDGTVKVDGRGCLEMFLNPFSK